MDLLEKESEKGGTECDINREVVEIEIDIFYSGLINSDILNI